MSDAPTGQPSQAADSTTWGRIDADGTVFVRTADGERAVGSWFAGDLDAGLAHFARRYDDLATEVVLLEKRLESGAADAKSTRTHATEILEQLPTAPIVGDLEALTRRLNAILESVEAKAVEQTAAKQRAREEALAAKEKLIAEAEVIGNDSTQWKASGDRLRVIVDEWKLIPSTDRKSDDALWKRFAAARDAFGRRRGSHFATLSTERSAARSVKDKLVQRAEELSASSDWQAAANSLKALMTEWKAAPRASREEEDKLWVKFRAAQDAFFTRRSEVFNERDAEQIANQQAKEAVIAEAEAIDITNPKAAQSALRVLQDKFDEVGHVPRDSMRKLDDRMKAAEDRVRGALDSQSKKASPSLSPFLVAMLERLAEAEQKLEKARKSGDAARIAKAEAEVAQRKSLLPT